MIDTEVSRTFTFWTFVPHTNLGFRCLCYTPYGNAAYQIVSGQVNKIAIDSNQLACLINHHMIHFLIYLRDFERVESTQGICIIMYYLWIHHRFIHDVLMLIHTLIPPVVRCFLLSQALSQSPDLITNLF